MRSRGSLHSGVEANCVKELCFGRREKGSMLCVVWRSGHVLFYHLCYCCVCCMMCVHSFCVVISLFLCCVFTPSVLGLGRTHPILAINGTNGPISVMEQTGQESHTNASVEPLRPSH